MPKFIVYGHYTVLFDWTYNTADKMIEHTRKLARERLDRIVEKGGIVDAAIDEIVYEEGG